VNWFRLDENGKFVWPGYGENMRVLKWIVERCEGQAHATETAVGWVPDYEDLLWTGLDSFGRQQFDRATAIDKGQWSRELKMHDELLNLLGQRLPRELRLRREALELSFG
jgi:phosphoenolpyruvate carboxykinase (GTP)